jgi:hypothetical protein
VSLYIRLESYIPEAVMIKTPAEISTLSSTSVLHRLALLLFTFGLLYLRKGGFNPFDFWTIILTSSWRIAEESMEDIQEDHPGGPVCDGNQSG